MNQILARDEISKHVIATLAHDAVAGRYRCGMSVCPNPVCLCEEVTLFLTQLSAEDAPIRGIPPIEIKLDIGKQALTYPKSSRISGAQANLAQQLLSQLREEDYQILREMYYIQKQEITESANIKDIEADFPIKEIESRGSLIAYNETLPFARQLQFNLDNLDILVLDQYCVKPKCRCHDALLGFMLLKKGWRSAEQVTAYFVDYDRQKWRNVDSIAPQESGLFQIGNLRGILEARYPDLYEFLRERHAKLKALYVNCKERNKPKPVPAATMKAGRNDPCPCGSGKKYKKCCFPAYER
ncbi:MAG: SEC-C metal-binding domain-containing protein [Candidatus Sumerlaeota bacterium]|nr:SEC-C metal-binding domain-containing protein [Candidatus Sumerlaeota bacterium]